MKPSPKDATPCKACGASTVEINDLALALRTLGEDRSNEASVERPAAFTVTVDGDSRDLHPIVRDEVYYIAAEAIRNAFRACPRETDRR